MDHHGDSENRPHHAHLQAGPTPDIGALLIKISKFGTCHGKVLRSSMATRSLHRSLSVGLTSCLFRIGNSKNRPTKRNYNGDYCIGSS